MQQWSVALLAALIVYVACWPVDSVSLEQGEALYACGLAVAASGLAWLARPAVARGAPWAIDAVAWALALWVVIGIWGAEGQPNRRMAVNEAWLWIAGAAVFTAARRCCAIGPTQRAMVGLLVAVSVGLAVHGWHQQLISLPQTQARYEADPEGTLAEAGLHAPPGSATRMMWENRLYDGGPTATFSLANSLAAPLLLGCLLATGMLLGRLSQSDGSMRTAWAAAALLTASMLWATHSRSAVVAAALGAAALTASTFLGWLRIAEPRPDVESASTDAAADGGRLRTRRRVAVGLAALGTAAAAAVLLFLMSDRELTERAPASVAFRLQYWRSTLAMVADAPWFGSGPGHFQSRYELYREPSASEQIAEPHNFLMETLAAGGFPAAGLLVALMLLIVRQWARQRMPPVRNGGEGRGGGGGAAGGAADRGARAVMIGAGGALLGVWVIGVAVRQVPDLDAHLWAVPAALLVLVGLRRWIGQGGHFPPLVGMIAVVALVLHLLAAGGWTVPGIAVPLWILTGSLLPTARPHGATGFGDAAARQAAGRPAGPAVAAVIAAVTVTLLAALYVWSIRPVATVHRSMEFAAYYGSVGRLRDAQQTLRTAAAADPWDPRPLLDLSELYLIGLLQNPPSTVEHAVLRRQWQAAVSQALQRSPETPVLRAAMGDQSLWLYQRWGEDGDLQRALRQYEIAAKLAPANERWAAQLAVVLAELRRPSDAAVWADRAKRLSAAGGHVERQLHLIPLRVAEVVGAAAEEAPVSRSAADLLANLPPADSVSTE